MEKALCGCLIAISTVLLLSDITNAKNSGDRPNFRTLQLVQVIMRHGQRNPIKTYPLDPYKDEQRYWPAGFGQLTDVGVDQTHELGQFIRSRYSGFLDEKYNQYETLTLSSTVERAIRSGLSTLRGLYPSCFLVNVTNEDDDAALNGTACANSQSSQVVPIRTVPSDQDDFIHMDKPCPAARRDFSYVIRGSKQGQQFHQTNGDIIRIVNNNAGINASFFDTPELIYTLDALNAQRLQGKELPTWVTSDIIQFLSDSMAFFLGAESSTPLSKRLRYGITDKILTHMKEKIGGDSYKSRRKFVLISGHDRTVITFLNIIGAFNNLPAPYACGVFVELHKDLRYNDHHIEVYYRNDTTQAPYKLQPSFCGNPCFLEDYRLFVAQIFPLNWEEECKVPASKAPVSWSSSNILIIASAVIFHLTVIA